MGKKAKVHQMKNYTKSILVLITMSLLLTACSGTSSGEKKEETTTQTTTETVTEATTEATTEVTTEATTETTTEAAPEATTEKKKETKYDTGTYAVNVTDEAGSLECIFQDGELYQETFDGIFDPWGGKDSNGYYNEIDNSPRYGMTVEEVVDYYEGEGYDVNVNKE